MAPAPDMTKGLSVEEQPGNIGDMENESGTYQYLTIIKE